MILSLLSEVKYLMNHSLRDSSMTRRALSYSVMISFAEIAWILVCTLLFMYVVSEEAPPSVKPTLPVPNEPFPKEDLGALHERIAKAEKAVQELQKKLTKEAQEKNALNEQLVDAKRRLQEAEKRLQKEIVGLRGPLKRVVMLFDVSGSMGRKSGGGEGRWDLARGVVATWLKYLPFEEVALITFNDTVRAFPGNREFINLRGSEAQTSQAINDILVTLAQIQPSGDTNTLAALEEAYQYPNLDTILLFTDGAPYMKGMPDIHKRIYQLLREHHNIPINTVGLGNYFTKGFSDFLLRVATDTGGTFLGR